MLAPLRPPGQACTCSRTHKGSFILDFLALFNRNSDQLYDPFSPSPSFRKRADRGQTEADQRQGSGEGALGWRYFGRVSSALAGNPAKLVQLRQDFGTVLNHHLHVVDNSDQTCFHNGSSPLRAGVAWCRPTGQTRSPSPEHGTCPHPGVFFAAHIYVPAALYREASHTYARKAQFHSTKLLQGLYAPLLVVSRFADTEKP